MLFTRKGDTGTSGLFGSKERFAKDSPVYEALGGLDELNSLIGLCRSQVNPRKNSPVAVAEVLLHVQEDLFSAQASIAGADKKIGIEHVQTLEKVIFDIEALIDNPRGFVIPGGTGLSALLDYTRAVCRRVERRAVSANLGMPDLLAYINRLSSLLYALARYTSLSDKELKPSYPERPL